MLLSQKDGNTAESSFPDNFCSPFDAAIDIWSSAGATKETDGRSWEGPARSSGSTTGCSVLAGLGAHGDGLGGEALTVIFRSPCLFGEVLPSWRPSVKTADRGIREETASLEPRN